MALTLDPATLQITIPQADLSFVSGTLYTLDSDAFRKGVMTLLASETYIYLPFPYIHNTEVTVAGTTYARTLEFINGYSIKFEDTGSQYSVRIEGSNNNIFDVENGILVPTSLVTVIPTNSAGLILNQTGILPGDISAIAAAVWNYAVSSLGATSTIGGWLYKKVLTVTKFLSLK
jgi:hypothetical protein